MFEYQATPGYDWEIFPTSGEWRDEARWNTLPGTEYNYNVTLSPDASAEEVCGNVGDFNGDGVYNLAMSREMLTMLLAKSSYLSGRIRGDAGYGVGFTSSHELYLTYHRFLQGRSRL